MAGYIERDILETALNGSIGHEDIYRQTRSVASAGVKAHKSSQLYTDDRFDLNNEAGQLNPNDPGTYAGMLMAAVENRTRPDEVSNDKGPIFSEFFRHTRLKALAERSETVASGLAPGINSRYVGIDLDKMKGAFSEAILSPVVEEVVVTGLNGAGKSTLIKEISSYLEVCGIPTEVVKFPRTESGPFSDVIGEFLRGKVKIDSVAIQYLMLADALDARTSRPNVLRINDRHPVADTLVFAPEKSQTALIAAGEMFIQSPKHIFVVDRHPTSCSQSVGARQSERRVFEKRSEQMTEQLVRFAELTALPGLVWINNNEPEWDKFPSWPIEVATRRIVSALNTTGIIERTLVKLGKSENVYKAKKESKRIWDKWISSRIRNT